MARPKIVMKDKLYIPAKFLQEDKVVKAYTHYEFDDNICRACDLRDSRPCADCRSCEWGGLKQSFNMAGYKVVGKIPYYTFPLGDIDNVEHKLNIDLDRFDFVDLTVRRKFTYPIEFTGDLFDYQETPVALLVKRKMGILKSKPRTGKCLSGSAVVEVSGQLHTLEHLWNIHGVAGCESVPVSHLGLTTNTVFGTEPISWLHRKRSRTIEVTAAIGGEVFTIRGTPEHPLFTVGVPFPNSLRDYLCDVRLDCVAVGSSVLLATDYLGNVSAVTSEPHSQEQKQVELLHSTQFISHSSDGLLAAIVIDVRHHEDDWVYDLTVEGSHTFIASGFMVHNTVMAVAASVRNQNRTIIMADQKDFLDGFYETIEAMTNLPALEEETGKKLFGFPKTLKDYETFQIILITYQQLIKDSKISRKRMQLLRKFYGALIVDEVHRSATPTFSKVLSRMTTRMRIGLSATPARKDMREILPYHFIGPVIAQTKAEAMTPAISVHPTPSTVKTKSQFNGPAGWVRFTQFLSRHNDRNMMIVDSVLRDLNNGRNIAIPIMYKEHAAWLKKEIDFAYGSEICALFMGGAKNSKLRKSIVDDARAGKVRVVIGIRRLIQVGINIPQWDTLYSIMPMNNAPNWEQESYRILTPLKDKKQPMIRMFVDTNMQRSVGCFKSTLATSLGFGHVLTAQSRERVKELFGSSILDKRQTKPDEGAPKSKLSRGMF